MLLIHVHLFTLIFQQSDQKVRFFILFVFFLFEPRYDCLIDQDKKLKRVNVETGYIGHTKSALQSHVTKKTQRNSNEAPII